MLYTSLENKRIKEIKKLHKKKYRDLMNCFLVEGEHLVLEAFQTGYLETLILREDKTLSLSIDTIYVTDSIFRVLSKMESPSGVMGVCRKKESVEKGNKVLVLDGIQDPGNLGTIIRSAVAFSIDTLVLSKDTVDLYNEKVVQASQGMIFHQSIIERDLFSYLKEKKANQFPILGTKVTEGKNIKSLEKLSKFVIIMGNEGKGMKEELVPLCEEFLYIPMNPRCESLNVGVATSILLYELGGKE